MGGGWCLPCGMGPRKALFVHLGPLSSIDWHFRSRVSGWVDALLEGQLVLLRFRASRSGGPVVTRLLGATILCEKCSLFAPLFSDEPPINGCNQSLDDTFQDVGSDDEGELDYYGMDPGEFGLPLSIFNQVNQIVSKYCWYSCGHVKGTLSLRYSP